MKPRIKFPRSEKVYLSGNIYPELRVAMRKVEQVPSTTFVGEEKVITPNPDIYIYDTSGPFSDPDIEIDLKKGLPRLREPWICVATMWSSCRRLLRNTAVCAVTTSRSTTCALSISHYPIAPNKANAARRCIMPSKASSLPKWNMWRFAKT